MPLTAAPRFEVWKAAISNCRKELGQVRLGMETTGVSADLVLDLRSIELALMRMHGLARVLTFGAVPVPGVDSFRGRPQPAEPADRRASRR